MVFYIIQNVGDYVQVPTFCFLELSLKDRGFYRPDDLLVNPQYVKARADIYLPVEFEAVASASILTMSYSMLRMSASISYSVRDSQKR
jgi:hypothetical protein